MLSTLISNLFIYVIQVKLKGSPIIKGLELYFAIKICFYTTFFSVTIISFIANKQIFIGKRKKNICKFSVAFHMKNFKVKCTDLLIWYSFNSVSVHWTSLNTLQYFFYLLLYLVNNLYKAYFNSAFYWEYCKRMKTLVEKKNFNSL